MAIQGQSRSHVLSDKPIADSVSLYKKVALSLKFPKIQPKDRFQRECLGTAFPKLFCQQERRSQEGIRDTFCEHAAP